MRQGHDGAIYLLTDNTAGRILKLVPNNLREASLALGVNTWDGSLTNHRVAQATNIPYSPLP